jgi:hypothetical protein
VSRERPTRQVFEQIADAVKSLIGIGGAAGGGAGRFTGKFGAGVAQWRPDVLRVLAMLGEPASLAGQVLFQMQTESGGNPNAINLTDSNAQAGDPSRGLLQTIMSTFLAYAGPLRSLGIYNPLANIYAAVNYAIHTYGRSLMRGGMGLGSGHGYDNGGWLEPGLTLAYNGTGGREAVLTRSQASALQRVSDALASMSGRSGGGRASQVAENLHIMLPDGATVGQLVSELNFQLQHAKLSGR